MSNRNHFPYQCELCDETWPSEEELQDHEVQDHFYCANCDRDFNTLNNIRQVSSILALGSVFYHMS